MRGSAGRRKFACDARRARSAFVAVRVLPASWTILLAGVRPLRLLEEHLQPARTYRKISSLSNIVLGNSLVYRTELLTFELPQVSN